MLWRVLWPLHHTIWIPKMIYLLWVFKSQPRHVKEKIISFLPEAHGCLMDALVLYNTERYVKQVEYHDSLTLVAVQYRFGFVVVI